MPIRLEYFGDDLDKIREFDPITQRSLDTITGVYITPTGFSPLISQGLRENPPNNLIPREVSILIFDNSWISQVRLITSLLIILI